jgi:hypothetical protein
MALPLTPATLAAAYDYLCTTPPFLRWNMPDSEEVVFRVGTTKRWRGWYKRDTAGRHVISLSRGCIGHTHGLFQTMAHEMVHLHQGHVKMETAGAEHNAAFHRLAVQVCKAHGWDAKDF